MLHTLNRSRGALALAALLGLALPAAADTIKVSPGPGAIQAAITAAVAGDTISISAGQYVENLVVPSGKDGLIITGKGPVFLDAQTKGDGITIQSSQVTVSKLTIRHAAGDGVSALAPAEGVLVVLTEISLDSVTIVNAVGAGVNLVADGVQLDKCVVQGCNGGVQITGAGANVSKVEVRNDAAAGIVISGNGTQVVSSTVDVAGGAGINVTGNTATLDKNDVTNVGGVMILLTGNNGVISKNQGSTGPVRGIVVTGDGNLVDKNDLSGYGGNLVDVTGATASVTSNKLTTGGNNGIRVAGDDPVVSKNQVTEVSASGVNCTGTGGTIEKNRVDDSAGSSYALVMSNATISKNQASNFGTAAEAGFLITGDSNVADGNTAQDGATNGFVVNGSTNTLTKNKALNNTINGILIEGDPPVEGGVSLSNELVSNTCTGNQGQGLVNQGVATLIEKNRFTGNRLDLTNATAQLASLQDQGGNVFDTGGLLVEPEILD